MICNKCGRTIEKIQYKPFHLCSINQCQCKDGGYELVIPLGDYREEELKCPECGEYPFKYRPYRVRQFAQVEIHDKSVEEIVDEIL